MLTLQQIIDRYNETRSIRGAYEQQMREWEDMYMLEYWTDDDRREAQAEGRLLATVQKLRNVYPAIRYQSLDPLNVGVQYGELYPSWAYHHFRRTVREVKQRWPEASLKQYQDRDDITVVDFWWPDPDKGDGWNAVAANDSEFLKKPYKTKYLKL